MKRYITTLILAVATAVCSMAATPVTTADSLAYYIGRTQGNALLKSTQMMPAANRPAYKKDFIRAFRAVLTADTAATGYIDGLNVGCAALREIMNMQKSGIPVNREMLADELAAALLADSVDDAANQELNNALQSMLVPLQQQARARRSEAEKRAQEQWVERAQRNLAAGREFMERLKATDKDVVVTPSGLAYKLIAGGTGRNATSDDTVELKYTGKLIDGTVFDSSNGNTVKFSPRQVIAGFGEGLKLMNKGAHYILYIPSELAYDANGPDVIGPNATLVFDVEVTDIQPSDK